MLRRPVFLDMTHGVLLKKILLFSLPLMASNILQLLFNAADIVVIGRFAGKHSQLSLIWLCLGCTVVLGVTGSALMVVFAGPLASIYNTDPAVIAAAVLRMRTVCSSYVIFGLADILTGAIRGCAVSVAPMVINLVCTCLCRLVWIHFLDTPNVSVSWVYASFPIGGRDRARLPARLVQKLSGLLAQPGNVPGIQTLIKIAEHR